MSSIDEQLTLTPTLRDDIDLMKAGLSAEEGFIASRVDGRTTLREISQLVGKPPAETLRILSRLARVGVVRLGETQDLPVAPPPKPVAAATPDEKPDYGNYIFSPALMGANCGLGEDERKRVIFFHDHLDGWNHYELLKVKRRDDAKVIKRAYFERSKEWHPDRFPRDIGPFKPLVDKIFQRVQEAHRVLSNPDKRAEYDEAHVLMLDEDDISHMLQKQRKKDRDEKRAVEAEARRKKRNPMRLRIQRARGFYEEALRCEADNSLMEALRAAQMAVTYDERPEYTGLLERLQNRAGELRIQPLIRRGQSQESLTNWELAIEAFTEAVRLAPDHAPSRLRLAFNLIMGGKSHEMAMPHAQKAVHGLPEEPEAHFVLGLCYEKAGTEKAAIRAFAKAVELKPNYSDAKKRLRSLKWGF